MKRLLCLMAAWTIAALAFAQTSEGNSGCSGRLCSSLFFQSPAPFRTFG